MPHRHVSHRRTARILALLTTTFAVAASGCLMLGANTSDTTVTLPAPALDPAVMTTGPATAVVAGGCFWGIQGVFQHVNGVTLAVSGYSGGKLSNPTYDDVITETTGHAEAVQITYDPAKVSYGQILQVFFTAHDPTELDRQGPDRGNSYRTNIFYANDAQKRVAEAYIAQLNGTKIFPRPIVTRVDPLTRFWAAEDYHQDFLILNPRHPYIVINDLPKIANFKRLLPSLYRETAVRTRAK